MKTFFTFLFAVFFCFAINAQATFNSLTSGKWSVATTWTMTAGSDADGIPDANDDVVILSPHTVTLSVTQSYAKTLLISSGSTLHGNNKRLGMKGNFTNSGSITSTLYLYMQATGATLSSTTTYTTPGQWYIQARCTVAVGTVVNKINGISIQNTNSGVVNYGSVTLKNAGATNTSGSIACGNGTNFWKNMAGSSLSIQSNPTNLSATKFTCSTPANLVTYAGSNPNIINTSYYNLTLTGTGVRTLTTNLTVLNDLTITAGSLSSNATNNVKVGGNLACNGTLSLGTTDTLTFNGTSATTQVVSGTAVNSYPNMVIKNTGGAGVQFNTNTYVTQDLFMRSGNCNGNNHLILKSDINSTARIAAITNTTGVSFSGATIIQQFINTMPGQYYDLSSPASDATVNDWDNEIYISGIGAYDGIGGPAGVDGVVFNGDSTMHTYDEVANAFYAVTGSGTALVPGTGYQLLLADDPGITQWNAKVLDTRGKPNFGTLTLSGLTYNANQGGPLMPGGDGWHLIGNPYASHIDYGLVTKTRMLNNIYYTDNGNYSLWPNGTIIPPYQGFYVETQHNALAHSLTFTEACKVAGNYTTEFYRTKSNYDIKLMISSPVAAYHHENIINFDSQASANYDEAFDATYRKFPNPIAPAIFMMDESIGRNMIRNVVNSKEEELTIPIGIFTPKEGTYYIDLSVLNSDTYTEVWIENTKTGVKYENSSSVAIVGTNLGTNTDYVLKMGKRNKPNAGISLNNVESTLLVFTTENALNLKSTSSDRTLKEVSIYDMTGKLMLKQSNVLVNTDNVSKIDISALTMGVYIVNTIDENGKTLNKKIIK